MTEQQIIRLIGSMRADYSLEADDLLRRIGNAVLYQDTESANEDAIKAAQKQAKVEALDELLEKIESENE
jgi:uncharacterized protein YeeX (DUF496 family)